MTINKFLNYNKLDAAQQRTVDKLSEVATKIKSAAKEELMQRCLRFFSIISHRLAGIFALDSTQDKSQTPFQRGAGEVRGIYLHGGVGRGKTMIMRAFARHLEFEGVKVELVHYQELMLGLHKRYHDLQVANIATEKIMETIAKEIAARWVLLCIDEFEIKDIADAMLMMRLAEQLCSQGVFIFITTNTPPEDLYKDGIQRASFMPFIRQVQKDYSVMHLDSALDYRYAKTVDSLLEKRIVYPVNQENNAYLEEVIAVITKGELFSAKDIEVFGRQITFSRACNEVLVTDCNELLERDLSYADYVQICKSFPIIILQRVRKINEAETDLVVRLINFIDNSYFHNTLLFASFEVEPVLIYSAGARLTEFARTVSRLYEMNSSKYKE